MIGGAGELLRLLGGRLPAGEELEALRDRRLRELVRHAYEKVPYYRRLFDDVGLSPGDVRGVDDLRHVPLTTRDDLQAAGGGALDAGFDPAAGRVARTSGSSGKPLATFRTPHEDRLRRALDLRSMRHAGLRPRDVVAVLGPVHAVPRRFHESFGLFRTHRVPTLLPPEEQIRRLREIAPSVLWCYPSFLRVLLERTGTLAAIARPRLLLHSAEPLDDATRRRATADGDLETRNFYGAVETGRIAWECAARDGLHVNADCLIVELLDDEALPGGGRSVVVTNLLSRAGPYLRYRLGDRCALVARPCPCGVPLPLITAPLGRDWDVVRLPSGRLVAPFALASQIRNLDGLEQYRLVQTHVDRLVLLLRLARAPEPGALELLRARLADQLGEPVTIDVELVEKIEEGALKFRTFISEVAPRS